MDAPVSISARGDPATGSAGGLKLVFKGSKLKHLLHAGRKEEQQQQQHATEWLREAGSDQQRAALPSQEGAPLSDSPGRPFSPSSTEPSPKAAAAVAASGPRSVHAQPPGKQPYPDDRTPEAEAARAQQPPQPAAAAADDGAGVREGVPHLSAAAALPAGPRSLHSHPPGKQPHPDDPAFASAAGHMPQSQQEEQQQASGGGGGGHDGAAEVAGPRSVYGQPPGKNPDQIHQIAANAQVKDEDELVLEHTAAAEGQPSWRWQHQQHLHLPSPAAPPHAAPWHAAGAATHAYMPAPAGSSHEAQQRPVPPAPGSRKRPASQSAAEGGQRKKAANGAAAQGGSAAAPLYSPGVPASLARGGEASAQHQIRPIPGAPRSLQHRQQLVNGATGGGAGRQQPAAAGRSKQQPAGAAARPKQQAKRPSNAAGGGQGASAAAGGAAEHQYRPGDVVWAKIGAHPWWPAQLQRPTAEEHFKPKHSAKDIFCVFYGSSDYNYLPPSSLKPFTENHPDYIKHARIKHKALQRAIDEAWVYGLQRQRPDVNW